MKGSTIKRGTTWTAYWSTNDPATGKRRQHTRGGFRIQKDARAHLNTVLAKVEAKTWQPDRKMTVSQLMADWLAARHSEGLRTNTLSMYRTVIAGWVGPHIGGLTLDELTPAWVGEMVEALRAGAAGLAVAACPLAVSRSPCRR